MAAFCGCCGAEITRVAEACPVCGTPRHGMALAPNSLASDLPIPDDPIDPPSKNAGARSELLNPAPRRHACCARF
jgi:hypothetical protein